MAFLKRDSKKKKRAITLIEMIVVLMILTMITGALAYNYKRSINQGKQFKADEMASRIQTVLEIAIAEGRANRGNINEVWKSECVKSPLIQDGEKFLKEAEALNVTIISGDATDADPLPFTINHDMKKKASAS